MPFIGKNPTSGFSTIVKDDLTPDGSTTAFTLSKQVASANDIAVFVGNVRQEPTDAYSVSGTTLTMTAAPASGLNFYVLHIAGTLESSVVPAAGTTVPGDFGVSGDLNVDTNVLHVDSASNKVGMGVDPTTMPSFITQSIKTINGGGLGISSDNLTDNRWIFFGHGTASSDIQRASIKNTSSDLEFHTAAVKRMTIDSDGYVTTPNQPAFRTGLNTTRTASGSEEVITWTNEQFDIGNNWNGSRFTAPVSGRYLFMLTWLSVNDGNQHDISISINGSIANGQRSRNAAAGNHETTCMSAIFNLNANDYVESVIGASGQQIYGDASVYWTSFQGYLLG